MRLEDLVTRIVRKAMRETRVAMPARIEGYEAGSRRARVQILVPEQLDDGRTVDQPVIPDVPVGTIGGGGGGVTVPLGGGDTGIVIFMDRDTGAFFADGERGEQDSGRMHSLNDAVFIPLTFGGGADADNVNITGTTVIIVASGGVTIQGDVTVEGDVIADGVSLKDHTHGGVPVDP
jgi:hypothetical protein